MTLLALAALPLGLAAARAQLPSVPVLQNAWANAGTAIGLNVGGEMGGDRVVAYGVAGAWAPASLRFQLTGGLGVLDVGSGPTLTAYGGRVAVPLLSLAEGRFGVAAFAGAGGARRPSGSVLRIPIGAGIGYRLGLGGGAARGISAYVTPFYVWSRVTAEGEATGRENALRASLGLDVGLTRSIGVTVGYEFGGGRAGTVGGGSSILGAGLSYAIR